MTEHAVAIAHPEMPAKERYRLELVMCVYWTCLQLESYVDRTLRRLRSC
jgi:hypothetical protein